METHNGIRCVRAKNREVWRTWLSKNYSREDSVWLIIFKKESKEPSVYYDEAVEEALCFGWIDSKGNKRDDDSYYLFFARRNPKSNWSKLNKTRVKKLVKEGRMTDAGMAMIEVAKKNGTWTALDDIEKLTLPKDFAEALKKNKAAEAHWEKFPKSTKRGILEWIQNAKRRETRTKRIEETVRLAQDNIRANQYTKK